MDNLYAETFIAVEEIEIRNNKYNNLKIQFK